MTDIPVSLLDLASVAEGQSVSDALQASVTLAQRAETLGYHRIWYAEHHNMSTIASSATAVLIAHIAASTTSIRVGSGGVMLPNHSPLVIAEQFGTLASLHPGRIDLGLGRAPGTDQITVRALRRDPRAADTFPRDVLELQGYLSGDSLIEGVNATPGAGTQVPLYILGSSLFGAQLAAELGLPFAFASHFAPQALHDAIAIYRQRFRPSQQLAEPYVIAALSVMAADTTEAAHAQFALRRRAWVRAMFGRGRAPLTEVQVDEVLVTQAASLDQMFVYTALGTSSQVREFVDDFRGHTGADEIMTVHQAVSTEFRLRSLEILALALNLPEVGH
ncbi:MAG: LLM class flavin-dependent oxidoreductase [Candidatus Nanopelagicales bacterium]|nr:LLM class flavin-dependent oxidoreductase [Candidatus Nanopelagicales bacterium]